MTYNEEDFLHYALTYYALEEALADPESDDSTIDNVDHEDGERFTSGTIDYGKPTKDGGHNHTYNKGEDRTPAQKRADKNKQKK